MREPLRGEERIRRDAERRVMMEASPAPALEVIEPQLVLQLLIVAFDPPPQHGELDELSACRRRWQRREPVFDRRGFGPRPFDEQPLFGPWCRSPVVTMRGPHPDRREAQTHGAPRARAPRHGAPGGGGQLLSQVLHAPWAMAPRAANQRRWSTPTSILPGWQWRAAGRPHGRSEEHTS